MVYRVFVEKKPELANDAKALFSDIFTGSFGILRFRLLLFMKTSKIKANYSWERSKDNE